MNSPTASIPVDGEQNRSPIARALGLAALAVFLILFPVLADDYVLHLALLSGIAVILASSLNLIAG